MGIKVEKKISTALAAASCALIGCAVSHAEDTHNVGDWDVSAAILFYQESDDRVQAAEPIIKAVKHLDTDETLSLKLTLDTLTGASPNGAVPTNKVQTFTRPSGNGDYSVVAGDLPLDDTFQDTRVAVNAVWDSPIAENWRMSLGGNISFEYDYRSFGISSVFAHDINNKNTTLTGGLAFAFDQINPEGDIPLVFAQMQPTSATRFRDGSSEDKLIVDVLMGVTQIIDRQSLFQFNYSISLADGYLNDPFKVISVVDGPAGTNTGVPLNAAGSAIIIDGDLPWVVYENRPDSRLKHAFFGQYKRQLNNGDVLDASYRFMIDDWGINSHTIDLRYRWDFSATAYLQPHLRLYQQSEADFYTPFFVDTAPTAGSKNIEASSDKRLAEFNAYTIGLEYGQDNDQNSWSVALEYYLQVGTEPSGTFGELNNQTLFPDVDALMLRLIYDF